MIEYTTIYHIFVIGDPRNEPERIHYLSKYFQSVELDSHVSYFQPTYKIIPDEYLQKYLPYNFSKIHNRPLRHSEISLFLNFIFLFEKIITEYKDGYFAVFESDVIFDENLKLYLQHLNNFIINYKPDILSIGSGCDLIQDDVNTSDMNFQIFPETRVRCTDSFIFSYKSIQKILNYFYEFIETEKCINEPIDNFLQTFLEKENKNNGIKQLWVWPSITIQGSQYDYYKSSIKDDTL